MGNPGFNETVRRSIATVLVVVPFILLLMLTALVALQSSLQEPTKKGSVHHELLYQ
jgi:hypothetical protein